MLSHVLQMACESLQRELDQAVEQHTNELQAVQGGAKEQREQQVLAAHVHAASVGFDAGPKCMMASHACIADSLCELLMLCLWVRQMLGTRMRRSSR